MLGFLIILALPLVYLSCVVKQLCLGSAFPQVCFLLTVAVLFLVASSLFAQTIGTPLPPPGIQAEHPEYVEGPSKSHAPVIRVYKDTNA